MRASTLFLLALCALGLAAADARACGLFGRVAANRSARHAARANQPPAAKVPAPQAPAAPKAQAAPRGPVTVVVPRRGLFMRAGGGCAGGTCR